MTWIMLHMPDDDDWIGKYESQIEGQWSDQEIDEMIKALHEMRRSELWYSKATKLADQMKQFLPTPLREAL